MRIVTLIFAENENWFQVCGWCATEWKPKKLVGFSWSSRRQCRYVCDALSKCKIPLQNLIYQKLNLFLAGEKLSGVYVWLFRKLRVTRLSSIGDLQVHWHGRAWVPGSVSAALPERPSKFSQMADISSTLCWIGLTHYPLAVVLPFIYEDKDKCPAPSTRLSDYS